LKDIKTIKLEYPIYYITIFSNKYIINSTIKYIINKEKLNNNYYIERFKEMNNFLNNFINKSNNNLINKYYDINLIIIDNNNDNNNDLIVIDDDDNNELINNELNNKVMNNLKNYLKNKNNNNNMSKLIELEIELIKELDNSLINIIPKNINEFKNHPIYIIPKFLNSYQAIYPEDLKPINKCGNNDIYYKKNVYDLHTKQRWLEHGKVIKEGEKIFKFIKHSNIKL
jgi:hypothetical protein